MIRLRDRNTLHKADCVLNTSRLAAHLVEAEGVHPERPSTRLLVEREVVAQVQARGDSIHGPLCVDMTGLDPKASIERTIAWYWGGIYAARANRRFQKRGALGPVLRDVTVENPSSLRMPILQEHLIIERCAQIAKRMVDMPRQEMGPSELMDWIERTAKRARCTSGRAAPCSVTLPAIAAVGRGSPHTSGLSWIYHHGDPRPGASRIALCGKGVTFDSGGLGLKSQGGMRHMKSDMAGGAAVLATVLAAAYLRLPVNVIGVVAAVENAIGSRAYAPGDLIRYPNGLIVEVTDTDSEGRLVLADLCLWAKAWGAEKIITVGTLTDIPSWSIGRDRAAVFSMDTRLLHLLQAAQGPSGEHIWPLPIAGEHDELLSNGWVDLVNSAGPEFGGLQPTQFLRRFVGSTAWAHMEISGPSWNTDWSGTGGTGYGVALLTEFLRQYVEETANA